MDVIQDYQNIPPVFRGAVVALGNFDGVHKGHQFVIDVARERADFFGVPLAVVTFEPHPQEFFQPSMRTRRLTPLPAKAKLLERYGINLVFALPFDATLSSTSAQAFISDILLGSLGAIHAVAGYDFQFGHQRGGDTAVLSYMGEMEGLGVTIVDRVSDENDAALTPSSSYIRSLLAEGKPEEAARLLGRPWFIEGRVEAGDARGRKLGFPTANLSLAHVMEPAHGVYAVRVRPHEQPDLMIDGIANLGPQPTFGSEEVRLESFLFDFDGDLYGQTLSVELHGYIRPVIKFDGPEALQAQIAEDIEKAKRLLTRVAG